MRRIVAAVGFPVHNRNRLQSQLQALSAPESKARHERGALGVNKSKAIGRLSWQRGLGQLSIDLRSRSHKINGLSDNHKKLMDTRPYPLTPDEWREVITIKGVRDAWGLWDDTKPEEFAAMVYGVKFNFHSGGPGYVGDLYILQGDALTDVPPMTLIRDNAGKMVVA